MRHDVTLVGHPAVLSHQRPVVPAIAQGPPVEPAQPAGPPGYGMQLYPVEVQPWQGPAQADLDLGPGRDREQHIGGLGLVVLAVGVRVADHIDVHPVPAGQLPEQGLADLHPLDPVDRHRLAGQVGQAAGDPETARGLGQGEVEHGEHPSADHGNGADGQRDQAGEGVLDHVERQGHGPENDQKTRSENPLRGEHQAEHQPLRRNRDQGPVGGAEVGQHAGGGGLLQVADPGLLAVRPGEQVVPEPRGLPAGQIAQLGRAIAGPGLQPQLGQSEYPRGQWLDDVDRLQPLERDLLGRLEDPAGLDPQLLVVDHEAGEVPGEESGDAGQHDDARGHRQEPPQVADLEPLVTAVGDQLPAPSDGDGHEDQPAADQRGGRMRSLGLLDHRSTRYHRGLVRVGRGRGGLRWARIAS